MARPRTARWLLASLLLAGLSCKDEAPKQSEPAAEAPEQSEPATTTAAVAATGGDEVVVTDELPTEPVVALKTPGDSSPPLPARAPGTDRRMVVQVKITKGKGKGKKKRKKKKRKKKLYLPVTRIAADVALESIDDNGSSYRFTPLKTTVLAKNKQADVASDPDGSPTPSAGEEAEAEVEAEADPTAALEAALAPDASPTSRPLVTDRFDVVTDLAWPAGSNADAATIGMGLRLALSHLAIPIPQLELGRSATWQVNRRVDLFGIPAWQTLDCTAKRILGGEMEVDAEVTYRLIDGEAVTGQPLGVSGVTGLSGTGRLRARYHMTSATPVDMHLQSKLALEAEGKTKRFGFELRVDEDYMARPDPRVTLEGQLVQGGLMRGVVPPGTRVWFNKRKVKVSEEGAFLFGFGRDAPARALLAFSFDGASNERHVLHVEDRTFEPETIDGLPQEMVDLSKETRNALSKSRKRIKKVRNKTSKLDYFREDFRWPCRGKITSTYGRKRTLNGEDKGYHWGVDVAGRVGVKIKAPAGGVVVFAEKDVPLSGNLIILDHGHGLTSSFLHLQKIKVKVGDEVKQGQVIGTLGNTGRSTGPHLDWRMNVFDTRVDPQTLVGPMP